MSFDVTRMQPAVSVNLTSAERSYPIYLASGALTHLPELLSVQLSQNEPILIISDDVVAPLFLNTIQNRLKDAGYPVFSYVVPHGEQAKSLAVASKIWSFALEAGLSRKSAMLALGGGVVGDLTGFCAATFFRGVPFIQVPTTLLAQVDSSVGGKVAVNFEQSKNGLGAFYQPQAVVIDPEVLGHLPERPLLAGLAEVVKYAFIETTCLLEPPSVSFFERLHGLVNAEGITAIPPQSWIPIIQHCCEIKAAVVSRDETEQTGVRSYLNLGHTFAHAYEEATHYETYLHGEAVSIGMVKAFLLSKRLGLISETVCEQALSLLSAFNMPMQLKTPLEPLKLLRLMKKDKKATAQAIRLILPVGLLGSVKAVDDVDEAVLLSILEEPA